MASNRAERDKVVDAVKKRESAFARLHRQQSKQSRVESAAEAPSAPAPDAGAEADESKEDANSSTHVDAFVHASEKGLALKRLADVKYGAQVVALGPGDSFGESSLESETVEEARRVASTVKGKDASDEYGDAIRTELATLRAVLDVDVIELSRISFNAVVNREIHNVGGSNVGKHARGTHVLLCWV
mgnify:CR=1 FL=1